ADDLDCKPGFLIHLAHQGLVQRFAELDPAAGQRIEPLGGRAGAAGQKYLAQFDMMVSTSASAPPLMMPPQAAISGLTQRVACSARRTRVVSFSTSRM